MLTGSRLEQRLCYEPQTGLFHWNQRYGRRGCGQLAGTVNQGRIIIRIDHINGSPLDNRIVNLREATRTQNQQNAPLQKNNKSGFKGVSQNASGYWVAVIYRNRKQVYLGAFSTPEKASIAYATKAREFFGEFARLA